MLPDTVFTYLQNNHDKHLETLKEFLRFASVSNSGHDDDCRQCAQWLARHLQSLGIETQTFETVRHPIVFGHLHIADDAPTVLLYGHYDVQPPDPLEQWDSDPFEPELRQDVLYGRGTADDKGQIMAHLMAVEAWQNAAGGVPINLKFLYEGQEEIGSPGLKEFIETHKDILACDAIAISDSAFFADSVPAITNGLRGLAFAELTLTGPNRDLHSGQFGGLVTNPVNALARMVAGMQDDTGRVTIPGFYDDVEEVDQAQKEQWKQLPLDLEEIKQSLGVEELGGGERGLPELDRLWARPTLDCNGIVGGYTQKGEKTIIPSKASVKLSMRLVANQDPDRIMAGLQQYVKDNTPSGVTAELVPHVGGRPFSVDPTVPAVKAASDALSEAFGKKTVMIRSGASIPITEVFQSIMGHEPVLMGFGLPTDRLHSPNEHFALKQFWGGSQAAAAFYQNMAQLG